MWFYAEKHRTIADYYLPILSQEIKMNNIEPIWGSKNPIAQMKYCYSSVTIKENSSCHKAK